MIGRRTICLCGLVVCSSWMTSLAQQDLNRQQDSNRQVLDTTKEFEEKAARTFANNVLLHVILHELGHAIVREFDLPILGNEETLADAFATHYLTTHMPHRGLAAISARVNSLIIESEEVPRAEWTISGEHNNDARRAYQIVALAIAADEDKYRSLAPLVNMSDRQIKQAKDYGAEIHRSWRRTLQPIWMPNGSTTGEFRFTFDPGSEFTESLRDGTLVNEIRSAVARIDWHSSIRISFVEGDGTAGWNRGERTITVRDGYIRRFIKQSHLIKKPVR